MLTELEKSQLQNAILATAENDGLNRVKAEAGSIGKLDDFVLQYEFASDAFPLMLCTLAARSKSDTIRRVIISNLHEEHGEGNSLRSHRAMYQEFKEQFFSGRLVTNFHASIETRVYVNSLHGLFAYGSIGEALGAILYLEAVTPHEYKVIVECVRARGCLPESGLDFWLDHIQHDGSHVGGVLEGINELGLDERQDVVLGIKQAKILEYLFLSQF